MYNLDKINSIGLEIEQEASEVMYSYRKENNFASQFMTYRTFADVTIVPTYSPMILSRSDVDILQGFFDIDGQEMKIFPVFGASMSYMRSRFAKDLHTIAGGIHVLPRVSLTEEERLLDIVESEVSVGVSIGVADSPDFVEKVLKHDNVKFISLDIAHGASGYLIKVLSMLTEFGLNSGLVVGNVGSLDGYIFASHVLQYFGMENDCYIKVGIGPGSVCTTRVNTGVGLGQMTLLEDIYMFRERMMNYPTEVISDGGVNNPGDFNKALSRSRGVMIGKYLASSSFSDEVFVEFEGELSINLYGMASGHVNGKKDFIEGGSQIIKGPIPSLKSKTNSLEQGLRSAMTYVGASNIIYFRNRVYFANNSQNAIVEGGIH